MELDRVLRTTGAIRRFAETRVEPSVVHSILDAARFAPSGGNRQPWRVAVVAEPSLRRRLADLMQPVWDEYVAAAQAGRRGFNPVDHQSIDGAPHIANELLDQIEEVPVVLAVAVDLRELAVMDGDLDRVSIVGGASIYPFCWSILLAAHDHGLGGVMTTFLSRAEPEAGPLLGLPEQHALAATIVLGVPEAPRPTKLGRRAVDTFATLDRFDGPPLTDRSNG